MAEGSFSHQLYVHLSWSTKSRIEVIDDQIESIIKAVINKACRELEYGIIAIGNSTEHVHLLVRFKPTHQLYLLVKMIKGRSSYLISERIGKPFSWNRGYYIATVGKRELDSIRQYVLRQKEHHSQGNE